MSSTPPRETSIQRTYQYLRIGIGAAGILIGVSIAVDLVLGGVSRPSISDYYYSDARNLFVGALVAVSFGLFALSGHGPQRFLLDAAAMFAPLIGLIPAPRDDWDADAAARGVWTYVVFGVLLLLFAVILRAVKSAKGVPFEDRRGFAGSIVIGAAWLLVLVVVTLAAPDLLRAAGHLASAGAFFLLTAIIALVHWRERTPLLDPADPNVQLPATPGQKRIYFVVGVLLLADVSALILVALFVNDLGWPLVAVLETVALVLFSVFWFVQSWQRRRDRHPAVTR
jgi:hypothetical protein